MKLPATRLAIRLTPGPLRPPLGICSLNSVRGGPESLLQWLETQLGLPTIAPHHANCVTEFASVLESALASEPNSSVSRSLQNDRWSTARELLARRDELALGGWEPEGYQGNDPMIVDLCRTNAKGPFAFPSIADRLTKILQAFSDGQRLPPHTCELLDPLENWPILWQRVLRQLLLVCPSETQSHGKPASTLRSVQDALHDSSNADLAMDESLRCVQCLSQSAAIEFIAAVLSSESQLLKRTVIVCEDEHLSMQLDACFVRYGVPTAGASVSTTAHPVLQVLPLVMSLCWEPVDPQQLLDFLTLPFCPLSRGVASRLAQALADEPGMRSGSWQEAVSSLCSRENDPDGTTKDRIDLWLHDKRFRRDGSIPTSYVQERCAMVAQWATKQSLYWERNETPVPYFVHAFRTAASQAKLLGEIATCQGTWLTQPQLLRLLEEAIVPGIETFGHIESAAGPVLVRSLANIVEPCHRVIWLGLGTTDISQSVWHSEQRDALRASGIFLDDGTLALASLRAAESRGLLQIEDALLAISLPQDREMRWHPLWLTVQSKLASHISKQMPVLEELIQNDQVASIQPFQFATESKPSEPSQPLRPVWTVDPGLLHPLETTSASELEERLACPLKWTFRHQANLFHGSIVHLPDDFQLKGRFCHRILEYALGQGGDLPSVDEAVAMVEQLFDERIELDAAPISLPERYRERQVLREQLTNATRVLISNLASGGYRIVGIEVALDGVTMGKVVQGAIDCLVRDENGCEAIIDFKYAGKRYRDMLEAGRCVQLATYAHNRFTQTHEYPRVGYFILDKGELLTHRDDPIGGDGRRTLVDGPSIQEVWRKFADATATADDWLSGVGEIPARPLHDLESLPEGALAVLDASIKPHELQSVCVYCDYSQLCGLGELE